jgi:hypothetical protein
VTVVDAADNSIFCQLIDAIDRKNQIPISCHAGTIKGTTAVRFNQFLDIGIVGDLPMTGITTDNLFAEWCLIRKNQSSTRNQRDFALIYCFV